MAINVSVGNGRVNVSEGEQDERDMPPGTSLAQRLKQTFSDATSKMGEGVKAAIAAGAASGSGVGVRTTSVNGKTHVVVTKGAKTMERDYDQAVKVSVTGQDPSVVTVLDTNDNVIEKTDF